MNNRFKFLSIGLLVAVSVVIIYLINQYSFQVDININPKYNVMTSVTSDDRVSAKSTKMNPSLSIEKEKTTRSAENEDDLNDFVTKVANQIVKRECYGCYFSVQVLPQYDVKTYKTPIAVDWFNYDNYKGKTMCRLDEWKRSWSDEDYDHIMELLRSFHELLAENGINFVINFGSLVGAYRHFDLVPWDDDADITIDEKYMKKVKKLIDESSTKSDLTWAKRGAYMKIFRKSSRPVKGQAWKYPFVDVFFHTTNDTHVLQKFWNIRYYTSIRDFFPLKLRPVGKYWFPVPNALPQVLITEHFENIRNTCVLGDLNHQTQTKRTSLTRNCSDLVDCHLFTEETCFTIEGDQEICMEKYDMIERTIYLLDHNSKTVVISLHRA